ncbi:MAG: YtxH domain-containing protein [Acidobacteria bacterium]|nr:YtxH domain-containing protein [Acidobacteriota bacterium]
MTKTSNKLPYIVAGSAVGGAIGYLFMTESGVRFRQSLVERGTAALPEKIEEGRRYLENKSKVVADKLDGVLDRAKESMDVGRRAYDEANEHYQATLNKIQSRNTEIASNVHKSVDTLAETAASTQKSFLDPVYETLALVTGINRGLRRLLGGTGRVGDFGESGAGTGAAAGRDVPFFKDERVTG